MFTRDSSTAENPQQNTVAAKWMRFKKCYSHAAEKICPKFAHKLTCGADSKSAEGQKYWYLRPQVPIFLKTESSPSSKLIADY